MRIIQPRLFEQKVKKLNKNQKLELDDAVRETVANPEIGEQKKGDLKAVYVHKFKISKVLFLLAYRFSSETIELIMLGPHENYYKDLKNYLKSK